MKSRLGTSWVVGTPISKEVFRWFYLGISAWGRRGPSGDGWPPSGRQPGGRGAKGWFGASSTRTVLDSRVEPRSRVCFRPL